MLTITPENVNKPPRYIAVRNPFNPNARGYAVKDTHNSREDFTGVAHTCGWYLRKYDAVDRANVYNRAENRLEVPNKTKPR